MFIYSSRILDLKSKFLLLSAYYKALYISTFKIYITSNYRNAWHRSDQYSRKISPDYLTKIRFEYILLIYTLSQASSFNRINKQNLINTNILLNIFCFTLARQSKLLEIIISS